MSHYFAEQTEGNWSNVANIKLPAGLFYPAGQEVAVGDGIVACAITGAEGPSQVVFWCSLQSCRCKCMV